MRYALLIRATQKSEADIVPRSRPDDPPDVLLAFARQLAEKHVLIDVQSLLPSSEGMRLGISWDKEKSEDPQFPGGMGERHVTEVEMAQEVIDPAAPRNRPKKNETTTHRLTDKCPGPFPVEELVVGWVIVDVPDMEAAIDLAKNSPFPQVSKQLTVEIRELFDYRNIQVEGHKPTEATTGTPQIQSMCREINKEGISTTICDFKPEEGSSQQAA